MAFPTYSLRSYAGGATPTTLATSMAANDLTFTLNSTTDWYETDLTSILVTGHPSANPLGNSGPFVVALDYGTATEEKILCASVVLATGVVTVWVDSFNSANTGRGYDGSAAQPHTSGSSGTALPVFTSTEAGLANYAVQQTVGQITNAGDLLYGSGANTLGVLGAGTTNQVLTSNGTASPSWKNSTAATYYSASTSAPTVPTQGQIWYQTDTQALLVYSGSAWLNTRNFAYYSASTSAPTVPSQGQMWYQTDTHAIFVYSGSAWLSTRLLIGISGGLTGGTPPSLATTGFYMQTGVVSGVTSGYNISATYPTAFSTGVVSVLVTPTSVPSSATGVTWSFNVATSSKTGFTLTTNQNATLVGFSYIAFGW